MTALRAGDNTAYEQLWLRHVGAATRVARRWAPTQADDLVSEAFLAVYDQIRDQGKGPTSVFRAYLFAVIRNIAARWHREGTHLVFDPAADTVVDEEPLRELERADDRAMLLQAFKALPDRWQRILWLTDIEDAPRPVIAEELGIRPNAVSSLYRRARNGLRVGWLREHVPLALRDDPAHAAAELPRAIVRGFAPRSPQVSQHLTVCQACAALEVELRASYRDGRKAMASVGGLAALGVVLPATASTWVGPATVAAAAGLGSLGAAALAIGVLTLGIGAVAPPAAHSPVPAPAPDAAAPLAGVPDAPAPVVASPVAAPPPAPASAAPEVVPPVEKVAEIALRFDPDGANGFPTRPSPPTPSTPGTTTPPDTGPEAVGAPTVEASTPSSTYLAPVFHGTVPADAEVAVQIADSTYRVAPDPEGTWRFDVRSVVLPAGEHTASVWTIDAGVASRATSMSFTIDPIALEGFPDSNPSVTLGDGMGSGLTFTMKGAPDGSICIDSDTGQSAIVPLDSAGSATRVLRLYNYGIYVLRLSACDGDVFGPDTGRVVSVTQGIFDPWVLDDVMSWDVSEF